jgi:hypothetical protein
VSIRDGTYVRVKDMRSDFFSRSSTILWLHIFSKHWTSISPATSYPGIVGLRILMRKLCAMSVVTKATSPYVSSSTPKENLLN